jgi:hypothetical protein
MPEHLHLHTSDTACAICARPTDAHPNKVVNQMRRSRQLAASLLAHGAVDAEDLGRHDGPLAVLVSKEVGIKPPSKVTWAMTVERVKEATES